MSYVVTDECLTCNGTCSAACPADAIYYDGVKKAIDQSKCTQCGLCAQVCALSAVIDPDAPVAKPVPHQPIHKSCDILVIGAGGSGLIAAARAAYLSGKKVIVMEKARKIGGSGWYSARVRPLAAKWQLEHGGLNNTDDYVRAAINTTYGELNPKLIANAYYAQSEFFDWYFEWGEIEKYYDLFPSGMPSSGPGGMPGFDMKGPAIMQKRYNKGNLLMTQTYNYCRKLGVEFLMECRAEEFIMKDGAVAGVKASDPVGKVTVDCKTCLVAAGSLVGNKDIVARYIPAFADAYQGRSPHSDPSHTGDGVVMAEKAGIPIDHDNICVAFIGEMGVLSHPQLQMQYSRPELLKINLNGERWYDEHAYREGCTYGLLRQPKCEAWLILDSKIANMPPLPKRPVLRDASFGRMMMSAVPNADGSVKTPAALMQLGPEPPNMMSHAGGKSDPVTVILEEQAKLKGGNVVRADTLAELAVKMGVPADKFLATVRRYNALCTKGHDDDFFKYPEYLIPIEQGPFYGIHNFLAHDGVFGGFYIDENMAVLGKNGPIPGLFASGDNTSSRYILRGEQRIEIMNDYPWALSSGFIAGNSMAKFVADL